MRSIFLRKKTSAYIDTISALDECCVVAIVPKIYGCRYNILSSNVKHLRFAAAVVVDVASLLLRRVSLLLLVLSDLNYIQSACSFVVLLSCLTYVVYCQSVWMSGQPSATANCSDCI